MIPISDIFVDQIQLIWDISYDYALGDKGNVEEEVCVLPIFYFILYSYDYLLLHFLISNFIIINSIYYIYCIVYIIGKD